MHDAFFNNFFLCEVKLYQTAYTVEVFENTMEETHNVTTRLAWISSVFAVEELTSKS